MKRFNIFLIFTITVLLLAGCSTSDPELYTEPFIDGATRIDLKTPAESTPLDFNSSFYWYEPTTNGTLYFGLFDSSFQDSTEYKINHESLIAYGISGSELQEGSVSASSLKIYDNSESDPFTDVTLTTGDLNTTDTYYWALWVVDGGEYTHASPGRPVTFTGF